MKKAIFFDLFSTLADLVYTENSEFYILGISKNEWNTYLMDREIYRLRMSGRLADEKEIMDRIVEKIPFPVSEEIKAALIASRNDRIKKALCSPDSKVLSTLDRLKQQDYRLGLISNADVTNKKYWQLSPLKDYFDDVIFSCDVGTIKPEAEIYRLGMNNLGVSAEDSIFIGDGASSELQGAKNVGMTTVLTEYFVTKAPEIRQEILSFADYAVTDFSDIADIAAKLKK